MAYLKAAFLGEVKFELDGKPITGFESDKARALLTYLLVEKTHPHRREKLAGLCWPDRPDSVALANLRRVLVNLRQILCDQQAEPPFLLITRQAVQIHPQAKVSVDVDAFTQSQADATLLALENLAGLYYGDFLAGFSLDGCPEFESWITQQREHDHQAAVALHQRLADRYEQTGDIVNALRHARRLIELDAWNEEAHLQAMHLLARSGQREAALVQYESCRRILAEELGVTPGERMRQLYEKVRAEELAPQAEMIVQNLPSPVFLKAAIAPQRRIFAARQEELASLHQSLANALDGKGQVVSVIGEAGAGKTALVTEFTRQAMDKYPELLCAWGSCHACFGMGDAYHPFRAIANMLAGEVEQHWISGVISTAHARRIWNAFPIVAQAMAARDPQSLPIFFDRSALQAHLALIPGESAPWLAELRSSLAVTKTVATDIQQSFIFEQLTRILRDIAASHPLLLILDDLHWADTSSLGMLFHLGRELQTMRLLLVCTYRPDETALESGMLPKLLSEFKQRFGSAWINLDQSSEASRRNFVNAFLDTETNHLEKSFRDTLFARTEGHPLFTIELLRGLEGRGGLVRNTQGEWEAPGNLDWDIIPAKVEGAIEERISRLEKQDMDLLCAASVEGEVFTAQVLAQVEGISEQTVQRRLARELGKQGRWVKPLEEIQGKGITLTRYRFNHQLYQDFLYQSLTGGEQRELHLRVAAALEHLYPPENEEAVPLLAYHYKRAGWIEKSVEYILLAGRLAKARYASQQALEYFMDAIQYLPDGPQRFDALADRVDIYDRLAQREEQRADIQSMLALAEAWQDPERQCEALLALAQYYKETDFQLAKTPAEQALEMAMNLGLKVQEAQARVLLGNIAYFEDNHPLLQVEVEKAVALYEAAGMPHKAASALHLLTLSLQRNNPNLGLQKIERAISYARHQNDPLQEAIYLRVKAIIQLRQKNYPQSITNAQIALAQIRRLGDQNEEGHTLNVLGIIHTGLGEIEQGEYYFRQAMACGDAVGSTILQKYVTNNLFGLYYDNKEDFQACLDLLDERYRKRQQFYPQYLESTLMNLLGQPAVALEIAQKFLAESSNTWGINHARMTGNMGLALAQMGNYPQADQILADAVEKCVQAGLPTIQAELLSYRVMNALIEGDLEILRVRLPMAQQALDIITQTCTSPASYLLLLARLKLALGDIEGADESLAEALDWLFSIPDEEFLYTQAAILEAQGKTSEAQDTWQKAYDRVMRLADSLQDEKLKHGWLENVALNRSILERYRSNLSPAATD